MSVLETPAIPPDWKYINSDHVQLMLSFADSLIRPHLRKVPKEIWHYTSFEGLSGILQTGAIYTTQVSCLNDNLEQRLLGDIIQEKLPLRPVNVAKLHLEKLRKYADQRLIRRDVTKAHHFVGCFTEEEDDLGQWRGYGTGECGYAVGFDAEAIRNFISFPQRAFLFPLLYNRQAQEIIADSIINEMEKWFDAEYERIKENEDRYLYELFEAFSWAMDGLASIAKHHKFHAEKEWRMLVPLTNDDIPDIVIRQKKTLLARHLPFKLHFPGAENQKIPITRVYVGPGPAQKVTAVSLHTFFLQKGYDIKIELSKIPYRVP